MVKEFAILQGSSLKDIVVKIKATNKRSQGDVLFTHFGLSGPAILHLSEDIYDYMQKQKLFYKYHLEVYPEVRLMRYLINQDLKI